MPVDKLGRTPNASQKIINVCGVSLGYFNNYFLRKGQAIDMGGKTINNLGSGPGSYSAVRKKTFERNISSNRVQTDMNEHSIRNSKQNLIH